MISDRKCWRCQGAGRTSADIQHKVRCFPCGGTGHESRNTCERCGEEVHPDREVWLELSQETGLFSDPRVVTLPENESQGGFCFGADCAKTVLGARGEMRRIRKARE